MSESVEPAPQQLKRVVGLPGAVTLGLGSILGTGVFVSLLFAVKLAGEWAILSVAIAAGLAVCNGLSSAQLAASHPVNGGAYEYGYRFLNPTLGFNAGWMFLVAKGASAATAALAFGECVRQVVPGADSVDVRVFAGVTIVIVTVLVLSGLRRSVRVNAVIVGLVFLSLGTFAVTAFSNSTSIITFEAASFSYHNVFHAAALSFVAYTGYGRVATMGEEIRDPSRNIPRAVIATLATTLVVYLVVTLAIVALVAPVLNVQLAGAANSLAQLLNDGQASPTAASMAQAGAMIAMLGVLLNLILGLSRVALAMARRNDLPACFATLSSNGDSPQRAVLLVAVMIGLLTLSGDILRTWSISAFAVLIYYATANLCALRQPSEERRYPRLVSVIGLCGCLSLVPFIDLKTIFGGTVLMVGGLVVKLIADFQKRKRPAA
ncbi:MAG: APC family permease [Planctomycetales bacterium]|jgi:APA family basic amino acid/polyamine antiporter